MYQHTNLLAMLPFLEVTENNDCFFFQIQTPPKRFFEHGYLQTKPFYREPWFLVALAAASIVIIIMVVAILCVKSKSYKYKGKIYSLFSQCVVLNLIF